MIRPRSLEAGYPVILDPDMAAVLDLDVAGPGSAARFLAEAGSEALPSLGAEAALDQDAQADRVALDQAAEVGRASLDRAAEVVQVSLGRVCRAKKELRCSTKLKRELMP